MRSSGSAFAGMRSTIRDTPVVVAVAVDSARANAAALTTQRSAIGRIGGGAGSAGVWVVADRVSEREPVGVTVGTGVLVAVTLRVPLMLGDVDRECVAVP